MLSTAEFVSFYISPCADVNGANTIIKWENEGGEGRGARPRDEA